MRAARPTEPQVSTVPLAAERTQNEGEVSRMRRAAAERLDSMRVDWAGLSRLDGDAGDEAGAVIGSDIEGQAAWWQEQLIQQGHGPMQVERLVEEYRRAALNGLRERLATARIDGAAN